MILIRDMWIFIARTEAEAPILWPCECEEHTHWKRPWCWERLKAGGEGGDRGWDGWRASPTQWTRVWASSGSWWRTGKPGVLQSWGHKEWEATEQLNNKNQSDRRTRVRGQEREKLGRKCTKMLKVVPSGFWDYGWFLSFYLFIFKKKNPVIAIYHFDSEGGRLFLKKHFALALTSYFKCHLRIKINEK